MPRRFVDACESLMQARTRIAGAVQAADALQTSTPAAPMTAQPAQTDRRWCNRVSSIV